ncbi:MAG: DUF2752 domain-containing protein [Verrucomicrobiales bacterium]|nr:DUF2752 domain-containing protein [Verrucomicrobiales bacterium]
MSEDSPRVRRVEVLVGPLVTFVAVVALLIVARFYERMPVQAPECGFKATFGIPCVSCGGTRAMQALSSGHFVEAIRFNPAVVFGSFVSVVWVILGLRRFQCGEAPLPVPAQSRRMRRVVLIAISLLALNWIYLILFLK